MEPPSLNKAQPPTLEYSGSGDVRPVVHLPADFYGSQKIMDYIGIASMAVIALTEVLIRRAWWMVAFPVVMFVMMKFRSHQPLIRITENELVLFKSRTPRQIKWNDIQSLQQRRNAFEIQLRDRSVIRISFLDLTRAQIVEIEQLIEWCRINASPGKPAADQGNQVQ